MPLPSIPLPRGQVTIGNETVEYRVMTRTEAMKLNGFKGREDEAEVFILTCGTGCSEDEARAFRDGTASEMVGALVEAILIQSGLAKKNEDEKDEGSPKA
jgi:hypothetical protein